MAKKLQKSPEYSTFFNTLIEICDKRNDVSVTSLIEMFSSSRSAMTAWKNGKVNVDIIPKLALYLNVPVDYLLTGKEKSSASELSDTEHRLLNAFNKLSPEDQLIEIGRIELMAEQTE